MAEINNNDFFEHLLSPNALFVQLPYKLKGAGQEVRHSLTLKTAIDLLSISTS